MISMLLEYLRHFLHDADDQTCKRAAARHFFFFNATLVPL